MKKGLVIFITTVIILILAIGGLKLLLPPSQTQNMANTKVLLETNYGNITIELRADQPITSGNFKTLVEKGFYNGVIFHRIIAGFMIQGGDPRGTGTGGPGYAIKDEFNGVQDNNRGTVAMANSGPNSGGSQFFINLVNNTPNFPKNTYVVFGNVVSGMDVVDKIAAVQTDSNDKPLKPVVINKASVL